MSTMLTVGVTNCNRLFYTKALLKSIESLARRPDVQLIVVDNASSEQGTREFLSSLDYADEVFLRDERDWKNDEYTAKNIILTKAKGDFILFLQDDCQMLVPPEVLLSAVDDFRSFKGVKCISMFDCRRVSLNNKFDFTKGAVFGSSRLKYWRSPESHFYTTGLFKKEVFDKVGLYPDNWPEEDNAQDDPKAPGLARSWWGKSEDYYHQAVKQEYPNHVSLHTHVPFFGSIWNDPRGYYAIVRGNRRCGHYLPPVHQSGLYYSIMDISTINHFNIRQLPAHFVDVCNPLGWEYARDQWGDQAKYNQNLLIEEGPHEVLYPEDSPEGKTVDLIKAPEFYENAKYLVEVGKQFIKPVQA